MRANNVARVRKPFTLGVLCALLLVLVPVGQAWSAPSDVVTDSLVGSGDAAHRQLTTPRSRTEVTPAPEPGPVPVASNLPTPPAGGVPESIPWVVPVMAILAAVLILAGIGSSMWRRMRP